MNLYLMLFTKLLTFIFINEQTQNSSYKTILMAIVDQKLCYERTLLLQQISITYVIFKKANEKSP